MKDSDSARRVCLVGAGQISAVHAEALQSLGIPLTALVEPNEPTRQKVAARFKILNAFASLDDAISAGATFDRAHVLVPPDLHAATALRLVRAGKPVLIEKPIATEQGACHELAKAARGIPIGVNQNFVFHPAFARLREAVVARAFGPPRFVDVVYHAQLRQLDSRQFGHWMFRAPRNIFLEQAVHPLSQIASLCGEIEQVEALGGKSVEIAPGHSLVLSFSAALTSASVPSSLRFAVGEEFPVWRVSVVCDDGVLFADILANRFWSHTRTRWMEPVDDFVSGQKQGLSLILTSSRNLARYGLSMLGVAPRSDAFFQSMRASIGKFHTAVDRGETLLLDAGFGCALVSLCDRIAEKVVPQERAEAPKSARQAPRAKPDVAVLGGTGFIGAALISRLRQHGMTVSVLARNPANLPTQFDDDAVTVHRGDIRNQTDVTRAIEGTGCVVNLAHGGGGADWAEIRRAMVGGAETVATACREAGNKRLIYISSIAALYLGPRSGIVLGSEPPDPMAERRADYARAKALSELRLAQICEASGLTLTVLRPGLVVGHGTSPFHSGLGFFNNTQHCIGWNDGRNPLPFVLVDDVAEAIALAAARPGDGRTYNLVGDVRPNARDYLAELARVLERPLRFHPKNPRSLYAGEIAKWCIKRIGGRVVPVPSLRDILSRGLKAQFDCSDVRAELGWTPVSDPALFYRRAFSHSSMT